MSEFLVDWKWVNHVNRYIICYFFNSNTFVIIWFYYSFYTNDEEKKMKSMDFVKTIGNCYFNGWGVDVYKDKKGKLHLYKTSAHSRMPNYKAGVVIINEEDLEDFYNDNEGCNSVQKCQRALKKWFSD